MNAIRFVSQTRFLLNIVTVAFSLGIAAPSFAAVVVSTYPDGPTWNGTPDIQTTATPQVDLTVNQQRETGNTLVQTIRTGESGFQLDRIDIYSGGQAGGTLRLNIYPEPVGGGDDDGFVNTSFSTDLLNSGAGIEFQINGSPDLRYVSLNLTGDDEITLAPNQKYAIEIDVVAGQFSWYRSIAGTYPDGNMYAGLTEQDFNGTAPANNRGQRFAVGTPSQRDGGLALFRQDGMTVSNQPDGAAWPGTPVHTTTGAADLTAAFDEEVTINAIDTLFEFPGGAATHTFTPDTSFKLDKFMIRAAGAPTTGELYIYQNVEGGGETQGHVNVSQSDAVLLAAMPFTFDGVPERTFLEFDLLGNNEIELQAGVEYAIDLRNTGTGAMYWMGGLTSTYLGGNVYRIAADTGTERFDIDGNGKRDAALALYAVPDGQPGDHNGDGVVDAADYVIWRHSDSGNEAGYTDWAANFGEPDGGGSDTANQSVPEPSAWLLTAFAIGLFSFRRPSK